MQAEPVCLNCKLLEKDFKCKAFPSGIPEVIMIGKVDHDEPFPGQDNDIVFTPIDDAT